MGDQHDNAADKDLDKNVLELLAAHQQEIDLPRDKVLSMRKKILNQIRSPAVIDFITIRADEGEWEEIAPKLSRKLLHLNPQTGQSAYLLRAEPGAEAPAHDHDHDELCYVLEGEIEFEHVTLQAGDYHFAPRGTLHGAARTRTGAVVLMQEM